MPRPTPFRPMAGPSCTKGSNTCGRAWAVMPMPLSATVITSSSPLAATVSPISPPSGVYLDALSSRLRTICASRIGSPWTSIAGAGRSVRRRWPRSAINGAKASIAASMTAAMSTRVCSSCNALPPAGEASCRPATRRDICANWCSMMFCTLGSSGSSVCERPSIAVASRIGAIGLLSSCATRARNSAWRCCACSAAACNSRALNAANTNCSLASRKWALRRSCSASDVSCSVRACGAAAARGVSESGGPTGGWPWNAKLPLPWRLARYIAASALAIRVAASLPSSGNRLMPTLAVRVSMCSPTRLGAAMAAITLRAISAASGACDTSLSRITNSSPPWRLTVSAARTAPVRRLATNSSTSSPTPWP